MECTYLFEKHDFEHVEKRLILYYLAKQELCVRFGLNFAFVTGC